MSHYIESGAEIIARQNRALEISAECSSCIDILQFEKKRPFGILKYTTIRKIMIEYITEFDESPLDFIKKSGIIEQKDKHKLRALYYLARLDILVKKYNQKNNIST